MEKLKEIIEKQKEFQRLVGFPIDSILERDRNEMSEKYILKLIEEAVEARKEFPSTTNPWSKVQKTAEVGKVAVEFADIFLFLINLINCWKLSFGHFVSVVYDKQLENIIKVKTKKLDELNQEILGIPTYTSGIGSGSVNPKYVFIGQNPSKTITHGYRFWSNMEDGSSRILLPLLKKLGVLDDCYFTNVVKSTTLDNSEPTDKLLEFWKPYLDRELSILSAMNPKIKYFVMGKWTSIVLGDFIKYRPINHPAFVSYGGISIDEYEDQLKKNL